MTGVQTCALPISLSLSLTLSHSLTLSLSHSLTLSLSHSLSLSLTLSLSLSLSLCLSLCLSDLTKQGSISQSHKDNTRDAVSTLPLWAFKDSQRLTTTESCIRAPLGAQH